MDPGGATGLAWAILSPELPLGDALRGRMHAGSTTVEGTERHQIAEIASVWQSFYRHCVHSALIPPTDVWYVVEDFVLKPGETAGGKDSTSPVALIWGVEGYRMGRRDEWAQHKRGQVHMPPMILQMAGQAKSVGTKDRLREFDLWVVGREHERSAWSHVAFFLKKYKEQFGGQS